MFFQKEIIFKFDKVEILISELVSSEKSVFLCFNVTQVWPILKSKTLFYIAHAQLQNSVNKA